MSIRIACAVAALAWAAAVQAAPPPVRDTMTRDEFKANLVRIEEQYDQSQARCKRVEGHARELCHERARAERDIQVAELDLRVQPTGENDRKLRLAKAEATYSLSLVKCKDFEGRDRGLCRRDAKMVFEDMKTEARLQNQVAEQSLRAENAVRERTQDADRIAQAEYNRARERCEMLPDEGRANCIADAKKRFDKF
jgi:hypothetical protein